MVMIVVVVVIFLAFQTNYSCDILCANESCLYYVVFVFC